jgi:2-iminobutanoate/2-iminopropanoate deaminase
MKKQVQTDKAPAAIGPYSQAIVHGNFVFCSGQVPIVPPSGPLEEADIRVQTRRVLSNVKAVLEAAGSTPAKVVKTTVFLTDLGNFSAFNEEYQSFFEKNAPGVPAPARSTIQVSALPRGAMVEVEAIAVLG